MSLLIFLEMPLSNCEINLIITWSTYCFIAAGTADNQETTFATTDTKLYIPFVTLSAQDNTKLFCN